MTKKQCYDLALVYAGHKLSKEPIDEIKKAAQKQGCMELEIELDNLVSDFNQVYEFLLEVYQPAD